MTSHEITCAAAVFDYLRDRPEGVNTLDLADAIDGWCLGSVQIALKNLIRDGIVEALAGRIRRATVRLCPIAHRPLPGHQPRPGGNRRHGKRGPYAKTIARQKREEEHRRRLEVIGRIVRKNRG